MRKNRFFPARAAALCAVLLALLALSSAALADTLVVPPGTLSIGEEAFFGDDSLDEVILSEPLAEIGARAFAQSSVRLLHLPQSVTKIAPDAFSDCPELLCLVVSGSYAHEWCIGHGVPWYVPGTVTALQPAEASILVKNGQTASVRVACLPEGAQAPLVYRSSDETIFTVSENGTVFGNYPGSAVLTVSTEDGSASAEIPVTVQANYRAVLFSESTFAEGVIKRNRGDVRLMKSMLAAVTGPDGGVYTVSSFDDLVASEVYARIDELLIAPSRDGDVSMFFFASHGDKDSTSQQLAGRLWCKRKQTWLELPTLAEKLSNIRGKVIVLLESCGPGAAVRDFDSDPLSKAQSAELLDDPDFASLVLSAFTQADPGLTVYAPSPAAQDSAVVNAPNLFLTDKFVVMTASAYLQISHSVGSDTYNLFPTWLTKGVGTSGPMPADTPAQGGNGDGRLTVAELFAYVYRNTRSQQTPQVHPKNSDYVLFLRAPE